MRRRSWASKIIRAAAVIGENTRIVWTAHNSGAPPGQVVNATAKAKKHAKRKAKR